jgi:hypothetical protein
MPLATIAFLDWRRCYHIKRPSDDVPGIGLGGATLASWPHWPYGEFRNNGYVPLDLDLARMYFSALGFDDISCVGVGQFYATIQSLVNNISSFIRTCCVANLALLSSHLRTFVRRH